MELFSTTEEVERRVIARETLQYLNDYMEPRLLEVIALHDVAGLTFKEIARRLGYSRQYPFALYRRGMVEAQMMLRRRAAKARRIEAERGCYV